MIVSQSASQSWVKKGEVWKSNSVHGPPFAINNFPSNSFLKLKMGFKYSVSPHASFILTRKYYFYCFFYIYIFNTAWKVSKYGVSSGTYFPIFELNTKIYRVNFRIQSECRERRTRKNPVFGCFSPSVHFLIKLFK